MNTAQEIADLIWRVYEIHDVIIHESGGAAGLREASLLHSAIARQFASFAGEELYHDDFEKAAALFHSLIKNHPFLDGTKRTAFASAVYFLEMCGHARPQQFPTDQVILFCISIAEENARQARGELVEPKTIAGIAAWFRDLFK
ncbi:MAG: type II toxin-antitoxin system death-on-curing family toxin [Chloroflexi bacterium]|nr:type II toxin-antitoxin system death-on-curing family toxin [Chloroflexota bacterium]